MFRLARAPSAYTVHEQFETPAAGQGLEHGQVRTTAVTLRVPSADDLWDGLLGGTVRTSAFILRQSKETQLRIRTAFDRWVTAYQAADGLLLPVSVKLAAGRKPR
jgi:hypothetical protein